MNPALLEVRLFTTETDAPPAAGSDYTDILPALLADNGPGTGADATPGEVYRYLRRSGVVEGLEPGTRYYFWAEAIDTAGKSSGVHLVGDHATDTIWRGIYSSPYTDPLAITPTAEISLPHIINSSEMIAVRFKRPSQTNIMFRAVVSGANNMSYDNYLTMGFHEIGSMQLRGLLNIGIRATTGHIGGMIERFGENVRTTTQNPQYMYTLDTVNQFAFSRVFKTPATSSAVPTTYVHDNNTFESDEFQGDYYATISAHGAMQCTVHSAEILIYPKLPVGALEYMFWYDCVWPNMELTGTERRGYENRPLINDGTGVEMWKQTDRPQSVAHFFESASESTAPTRPEHLFTGVLFNGIDQEMAFSWPGTLGDVASSMIVVVAFRPAVAPNSSDQRGIVGNKGTGNTRFHIMDASMALAGTPVPYPAAQMPAPGEWSVAAARVDDNVQTGWINGTYFLATTTETGERNGEFCLGVVDGAYFSGEIGEVLLLPRNSSTSRDELFDECSNYMLGKWRNSSDVPLVAPPV
jgi:hypothetical protein